MQHEAVPERGRIGRYLRGRLGRYLPTSWRGKEEGGSKEKGQGEEGEGGAERASERRHDVCVDGRFGWL